MFDRKKIIDDIKNNKIEILDLSHVRIKEEKEISFSWKCDAKELKMTNEGLIFTSKYSAIKFWDANGQCVQSFDVKRSVKNYNHEQLEAYAFEVVCYPAKGFDDEIIPYRFQNNRWQPGESTVGGSGLMPGVASRILLKLSSYGTIYVTYEYDNKFNSDLGRFTPIFDEEKSRKLYLKEWGDPLVLDTHPSKISHLIKISEHLIASASSSEFNHTIRICDLRIKKCIATLSGDSEISSIHAVSSKRLLSITSNRHATLWDIQTKTRLREFNLNWDWGRTDRFNLSNEWALMLSNNQLACISGDKTIKIWNVETGSEIQTFVTQDGIEKMGALPDGRLVTLSGQKIQIWNTAPRPLRINDIKDILFALEKNTSVKQLILRNMLISDYDIEYSFFTSKPLINLIKNNSTIHTINLSDTAVSDHGISNIRKSIKRRLNLTINDKFNPVDEFEALQNNSPTDIIPVNMGLVKPLENKIENITAGILDINESITLMDETSSDDASKEEKYKPLIMPINVSPNPALSNESTKKLFSNHATVLNENTLHHLVKFIQESEDLIINNKQLQKSLANLTVLRKQMQGIDGYALQVLQGKAKELQQLIDKESLIIRANQERSIILEDDKLSDYYYFFITQFTDVWLACKTIHSGKVANSEMTAIDYVPAILDKGAEYISFPGIALLKDIATMGIKQWSAYDKKIAVNRMANYFEGLVKGDIFIEAISRQLTLTQAEIIQSLVVNKAGAFRKIVKSLNDLKNKITANDIDNAIREHAAAVCQKIIIAIMKGHLKPHPSLESLPRLIANVLESNNINEISNVSLSPLLISTNMNTVTEVKNNSSHTMIQLNLRNPQMNNKSNETYDNEIQLMQNRLKQQEDESTALRIKIEQFERLKNQKISDAAGQRDVKLIKAQLDNLRKELEQSGIVSPVGNQLQVQVSPQSNTPSALVSLASSSRIAALEAQMSVITPHVMSLLENQGIKPRSPTQENSQEIRRNLFRT